MAHDPEIHIGQWFHPLLNPEYYPELALLVHQASDLELRRNDNRIANQYQDIAGKLETARYHAHMLASRIAHSQTCVASMLADLRVDMRSSPEPLRAHVADHMLVEFRDHILVAHLEALVVTSKSMLDSLTQFYSIAFARSVKTFSDKGSNVIADLRNLGASHSNAASELTHLVQAAKTKWIDEMIDYRNDVTHFGQLREFRCLHVVMSDALTCAPERVHAAVMPSRKPVDAYVLSLLREVHEFAAKWVRISFAQLKSVQTKKASGSDACSLVNADLPQKARQAGYLEP
jgi:hypothetical protein